MLHVEAPHVGTPQHIHVVLPRPIPPRRFRNDTAGLWTGDGEDLPTAATTEQAA